MPHTLSQEMKQCIEKCLECYRTCREMAMNRLMPSVTVGG